MPKAEADRRLGQGQSGENETVFPNQALRENATTFFLYYGDAPRNSHHENIKFLIAFVDSPPYIACHRQQTKTSPDSTVQTSLTRPLNHFPSKLCFAFLCFASHTLHVNVTIANQTTNVFNFFAINLINLKLCRLRNQSRFMNRI